MYLGDHLLNNDFHQVDEFQQMTAGVATLFVRSGDDFVRISTSLTKQDGSRAIGTQLDRQHPAYPKLMAGQTYVGRAVLFDRNYMTRYVPVRDDSGRVIAVLFVGFDYTEAQNAQFANLAASASARPVRWRCWTSRASGWYRRRRCVTARRRPRRSRRSSLG